MFMSLREEGVEAAGDFVELCARQFRKDGERKHFARGALTLGALTLAIPKVREARLQMERQRVVDGRPDSPVLEEGLQRITTSVRHANGVLIEDRLVFRRHVGTRQHATVG